MSLPNNKFGYERKATRIRYIGVFVLLAFLTMIFSVIQLYIVAAAFGVLAIAESALYFYHECEWRPQKERSEEAADEECENEPPTVVPVPNRISQTANYGSILGSPTPRSLPTSAEGPRIANYPLQAPISPQRRSHSRPEQSFSWAALIDSQLSSMNHGSAYITSQTTGNPVSVALYASQMSTNRASLLELDASLLGAPRPLLHAGSSFHIPSNTPFQSLPPSYSELVEEPYNSPQLSYNPADSVDPESFADDLPSFEVAVAASHQSMTNFHEITHL